MATGEQARTPDHCGGSTSRLNLLIASTAAGIGLIYGYDLGSIASAILFLEEDLGVSTWQISVITSWVVLGQLVGALAGGRIANAHEAGRQALGGGEHGVAERHPHHRALAAGTTAAAGSTRTRARRSGPAPVPSPTT